MLLIKTVPAGGLPLLAARTSAGTVLPKFGVRYVHVNRQHMHVPL